MSYHIKISWARKKYIVYKYTLYTYIISAPTFNFIKDKRIKYGLHNYQKFKWKINWLDYLMSLLSGVLNAFIVSGILFLPKAITRNLNTTRGYDQVITTNNLTLVTTVTNRVNYVINTTNYFTETVDLTSLETITNTLEQGFDTQVTDLVNTITNADTTITDITTDLRNFELFLTGLPGLFNNDNDNFDESLQTLIDIFQAILNARSGSLFLDNAGYQVSGMVGIGDSPGGQVEYIEIDMDEHGDEVHAAIWDYIVKAANLKPRSRSLLKDKNKYLQFDGCLSNTSAKQSFLKVTTFKCKNLLIYLCILFLGSHLHQKASWSSK